MNDNENPTLNPQEQLEAERAGQPNPVAQDAESSAPERILDAGDGERDTSKMAEIDAQGGAPVPESSEG